MKTIKILALLVVGFTMVACQGDWDEPNLGQSPFGNNAITSDGIITIAELKNKYHDVINADVDKYVKIDQDIKIKGRVTGNDIGGNLYKQFTLQDETAAIVVSVNQSGMYGFLPLGQEIIIALKDLYIGGYRKQPQIGFYYNNSKHNAVELGRMYKELFQKHFTYVGSPDTTKIEIIKGFVPTKDLETDNAKLVRLENVHFVHPNPLGLGTFAPDSAVDATVKGELSSGSPIFSGGCVNMELLEYDSKTLVIRTSTYARFAAMKLPYDDVNKRPKTCNITGIATRYNNVWQILIRKESDIEIIKDNNNN